jgi:hypothetical protein
MKALNMELPLDVKPAETLPYVAGSDTSKAAAQDAMASASGMRAAIYRWGASLSTGFTCDEAEHHFGYRHQTCSARIRELVLGGRIKDSKSRRATRSGSLARVYVTTAGDK